MANIEHVDIADPNIHEPKGIAAAAADKVYVSDGAASGSWQKITTDQLDTSSIISINRDALSAVIADISTAGFIIIPVPFACTFVSALMILGGAIATADSSISFTRDDAASFGSSVVVAYSGSAEGDDYTFTPSVNTSVSAGGYIKITTDGASTNTIPLFVTVVLEKT